MPTKMRLQRFGKKGKPFYHIVIADGRAPRDGRFIEKIGTYDPIPNPADINLNFDKALDWLQKGAQPSDTVRAILSYKGVLYKNHLLIGVKKGALSETEAEAKFQAWLNEKEGKVEAKRQSLLEKDRTTRKERLEAEAKIKEARADEISKQRAAAEEELVKKVREAAAENEPDAGDDVEVSEEPITKEAVEEAVEEAKAEEKPEAKAEEKPEAKAEEKSEEKPEAKAEEKAEEKPEAKADEKVEAGAKAEGKEEKEKK